MKSESEIQTSSPKHLTGLDGLRFIAIMILVLGHCAQKDFVSIGGEDTIMSMPLPDGCLTILFVLSGFLAGYFSEKSNDVKTYYKKRAVRLFPVYYLYFVVVSLVFLLFENKSEVFNNNLWYFMGKISYDVFVIHIMVLLAISRTYQCIGITDVSLTISIVTYILATVITIILAWLCNKYVEEPFSKIKK